MAVKVATANGNMTTAGTWQDVNATSFVDYESAVQNLANGVWNGAGTFTPGAIQIDGIILKVANKAASVSGTVSVRLYNNTAAAAVAGTQVDLNASDVPGVIVGGLYSVGWMYFKFAAPVTLIAGNVYVVQAQTSVASTVAVYYSGVNYTFGRGLVLTGAAAAAPTTGDQVIITGAWTSAGTKTNVAVTMDQTSSAVKYGTTSTSLTSVFIGAGGTLSFGTAAATNYFMNVQGIFWIGSGGILNIGTVATPVPVGSSATLNFDITGSAGAYYLRITAGTLICQGQPRTAGKNVVGCVLTANHTGGGTTFTVDRDTGWKAGDAIIVSASLRTVNRAEALTLAVDATADTLTTGATSYNHAGDVASGVQCHAILAVRNVTIRTTTTAKVSYILLYAGTLDADWTSFYGMAGASSSFRGIQYTSPVALNVDYCHFDGFDGSVGYGLAQFAAAGQSAVGFPLTFTNITATKLADYLFEPMGTSSLFQTYDLTLEDIWLVGYGSLQQIGLLYEKSQGRNVTLTRIRGAGGYSSSPMIRWTPGDPYTSTGTPKRFTIQDSVFSDFSAGGFTFDGVNTTGLVMRNVKFFRGRTGGGNSYYINITSGARDFLFDSCEFLSAYTAPIFIQNQRNLRDLIFRSCKFGGEAAYATTNAVIFGASGGDGVNIGPIRFEECLFGDAAGGVFTDPTNDFGCTSPAPALQDIDLALINCLTGTASPYSTAFLAMFNYRSVIRYQRAGGVLGAHSVNYPRLGTVARDAVFFRSSAPSEKMTPTGPSTATAEFFRLQSAVKRFDVNTGSQRTPQVYVYLDPAYNGLAPRLIMKSNPAIGQTGDAVLATHTGTTGVWEKLSGIMPAAAEDDGQVEIFVDCTGTAGAVWCDDWGI